MKVKYFFYVAFLTLALFGCDDNTDDIGLSLFPDSDKVNVKAESIPFDSKSISIESVYAKTKIGYLGKYTDSTFGELESSFITQFNCPDNITFPFDVMLDEKAYKTEVVLFYKSYFGDSLNTSHLSIYELNGNEIKDNFYTDFDPSSYYSVDNLIGSRSYTAVDNSISEEVRKSDSYVPQIRVDLPNSIGQEIIDKNKSNPEFFSNSDEFIKNIFKGVYIKTDAGDGTILYVNDVILNVHYKVHITDKEGNFLKKQDGTDSIGFGHRSFAATQEVIQANQIVNDRTKIDEIINNSGDKTFLKTPSGIFTEIHLPIKELESKIKDKDLNSAKIAIKTYVNNTSDDQFAMKAPSSTLLLKKNNVETFFETNSIPDNETSFIAKFGATNKNEYVFNQLARLVNNLIEEKEKAKEEAGGNWTAAEEEEWEKNNNWGTMVLVPVTLKEETDQQNQSQIISVKHDLKPSFVELLGGNDKLNLEVIYSGFNK